MIRSMTGYGAAEKNNGRLLIKVEFKSVNGKNLELNVRLPRELSDKELVLRNRYQSRLERGTVALNLTLEFSASKENPSSVNEQLLKQYYRQLENIANELGADKSDIFRCALLMPDVMQAEDKSLIAEDWNDILSVADLAFEQYDAYRLQEGKETAAALEFHARQIAESIAYAEAFEPERISTLKSRLIRNLEDLLSASDYDKNRFEQELIYYLEKWDIQEEKHRLAAHCALFHETLGTESSGKKLGFISQEMGREINTLGSKANHAGMQQVVITMKEHLEKIKEQILNII